MNTVTQTGTGPARSTESQRTRLGMLLFIGSEGVFFLLLVIAYVTYHRQQGNGPTASSSLALGRTAVFSALLFASSATMAWASSGLRSGARRRLGVGLLATLVLGTAFLVGQGTEYADLLRRNVTISRDLFGTTFFTLTGFHGLHVFVGLVLIAGLFAVTWFGQRKDLWRGATEAVAIYWHFVDGVWVVVFSVVYLWAFL
jgi:heme/copper-type cytochrome/quinol oxidase subunit 3